MVILKVKKHPPLRKIINEYRYKYLGKQNHERYRNRIETRELLGKFREVQLTKGRVNKCPRKYK
ncbi:hypothetical protein L873DRAFT_1823695 [Choiromyces venosus 120613-1]|uniref:Uncharacterized protein n=1 Tax=Choiromyces venosus 120613-1 TaxID=1336337 RepID=A0A3N4IS25_9PEZI|nr:hypothetical protein L873DRAFT_1823695 [Choiromyces venosus 120613-1]